jgi:ubiquinone/menaquinone biosynthesis C-methylase UbiE
MLLNILYAIVGIFVTFFILHTIVRIVRYFYKFPIKDSYFDVIYMITVINEIPDIPRALKEFYRVLKPSGKLVFSELLLDPDYPLAGKLTEKVQTENFRLVKKVGNFFYYTLIFKKDCE